MNRVDHGERLTLTHDELVEHTGYTQHVKQAAVMRKLGVPVHVRPDGSVAVVRAHLVELMRRPSAESGRDRPKVKSHGKAPTKSLSQARLALVR
ncbi:MAG: DUF4224 domain-containing protein [Burkholderiales bacterium]|nr:DUF4224 domain-containing protein [Burkholderiales bacterium]